MVSEAKKKIEMAGQSRSMLHVIHTRLAWRILRTKAELESDRAAPITTASSKRFMVTRSGGEWKTSWGHATKCKRNAQLELESSLTRERECTRQRAQLRRA